ncbi:hypothetical protein PFTANZ_06079, partial [Plasmodium falciparum Tanzania (2000708)]
MAAQGRGGGEDGIDERSAKNLLDSIGKKVYKEKVKSEAQTYTSELKGDLSQASIFVGKTAGTTDTCNLVQKYYKHFNGGGAAPGERYPCKELSGKYVERFSNKIGGQCTNEKIEGNKYINGKDEENVEEKAEGKQVEEPTQPPATTTDTTTPLDVCNTVAEALKGKLDDACKLKYVTGKNYGWKCVPTTSGDKTATSDGDNTTTKPGSDSSHPSRQRRAAPGGETSGPTSGKDTGSICVPPRRRKLYIQKLVEWAKTVGNTQGGGKAAQGDTPSQSDKSPPVPTSSTASSGSPKGDSLLLTAFVESAAVETFFLWDRYKKIKEKERQEKEKRDQEANGLLLSTGGSVDGDSNDPQQQLRDGKIPDGFLRQMFYTLGDYRDILFSGSKDDNTKSSTYNDIINGDKEIKGREEKIKGAISSYFSNSGSKPSVPQNSVENPESWWTKHGPDIWNGMICALTYKENGSDKPQVDPTVKNALWDEANKKPKKTDNGPDYTYEKVELKEDESGTEAKTTGGDDPINNPKLKDFVEIPTYFRWLHEWGSDFCGKRKRMLKNVKKACREKNDDEYKCSGDGHDCTEYGDLKHKNMFDDLDCPDCYKQ